MNVTFSFENFARSLRIERRAIHRAQFRLGCFDMTATEGKGNDELLKYFNVEIGGLRSSAFIRLTADALLPSSAVRSFQTRNRTGTKKDRGKIPGL